MPASFWCLLLLLLQIASTWELWLELLWIIYFFNKLHRKFFLAITIISGGLCCVGFFLNVLDVYFFNIMCWSSLLKCGFVWEWILLALCLPSFFKCSDISLALFVSTFCYPEDTEDWLQQLVSSFWSVPYVKKLEKDYFSIFWRLLARSNK